MSGTVTGLTLDSTAGDFFSMSNAISVACNGASTLLSAADLTVYTADLAHQLIDIADREARLFQLQTFDQFRLGLAAEDNDLNNIINDLKAMLLPEQSRGFYDRRPVR